MKKVLCCLVFFTILFFNINIKALEVSQSSLTLKPGTSDTVSLYANTEKEITSIDFTFVYKSYDVPASFKAADGLTDTSSGIHHSITFTEAQKGKILLGTITINVVASTKLKSSTANISNAVAKDTDGNNISLTSITITTNVDLPKPIEEELQAKAEAEAKAKAEAEAMAKAEQEANEEKVVENEIKIDTDLLSKIESEIVSITIIPGVYEYTVNVAKEIEELDLKPIAKTPDTEITISNQKISELTDNKITIKAKTSDAEKEYIIKVNIKEDKKDEEEKKSNYKAKWIIIILFMFISLGTSLLFLKNK